MKSSSHQDDPAPFNRQVASRLDEVAQILEEQGANPFRVRAYRQAAETLRRLPRPVSRILEEGGLEALEALPHVGESLARSIRDLLLTGRLPMLQRMRGEADPVALLLTVPGIGRKTAERLHHDLGLESLDRAGASSGGARPNVHVSMASTRCLTRHLRRLAVRRMLGMMPREEHGRRVVVTEARDAPEAIPRVVLADSISAACSARWL